MKRIYKKVLNNIPAFVLLLPCFFVLHGLTEHLFYINFKDAFFLLISYLGIVLFIFLFLFLIYKNYLSAGLISFLFFAIFFFYGAIQDVLKKHAPIFFSKHSFLLAFLFILFIFFIRFFNKIDLRKKIGKYLNTLLILLLILDFATITKKLVFNNETDFTIAKLPHLIRPNVYLLVLDGYAGAEQLKNTFNFKNNFIDSLSKLGFNVSKGSKSNYNATAFSMASLLSMSFNNNLKSFDYTDYNLNYCYQKIANSSVVSGFESLGYTFINNSIFDIRGNPSPIKNKTFLKSGTQLITGQTLVSRVKGDLYDNFLMKYMKGSYLYKKFIMKDYFNNELLYYNTVNRTGFTNDQPVFIYTHLLMPHFPYYFNSKGEFNSLQNLGPENMKNQYLYLEYLQYVNFKVLNLIKNVIRADENSIVIIVSDHGFRYAKDGDLMFSNLIAIYDPIHMIKEYGPSISNVNIFRIIFNNLFNTQLKLYPDKQFK